MPIHAATMPLTATSACIKGIAAPVCELSGTTVLIFVGLVKIRLLETVLSMLLLFENDGNAVVAVIVVRGTTLISRSMLVNVLMSSLLYGAADIVKDGMRRSSHIGGSSAVHFMANVQHQPFPQSTGDIPQ